MSAIQIHVGAAPFTLGQTREALRAAAGEPDALEALPAEAEQEAMEHWYFAEQGVGASFFEADGWRLGELEFEDGQWTIGGESVIGCPVDRLPGLVKALKLGRLKRPQAVEGGGRCHECPDAGVAFWEAGGVIASFSIFPAYEDDGETVRWPDAAA
jgi:hypothetical protein